MAWYSIFAPDVVAKSYKEITVEQLLAMNCRLLAIDIDNTLVPYYQAKPDIEVIEFFRNMEKFGIEVILLSNNTKQRVDTFAQDLNTKAYSLSKKPLPKVYKQMINDTNIKSEHIVCVGDQLLTDVLGAHLAKLRIIWCQPLVKAELIITRFNRILEHFIYRILLKKGLLDEKM